MTFDSWTFALFLPLVVGLAWVLPLRARNWWLLAASYWFYGAWDWRFLGLIVASTALDFHCARRIEDTEDRRVRRRYVALSLVGNLGTLGLFKYLGWFTDSAAALLQRLGVDASLPTLEIVLPVGISFYTFQTLSYTLDVHRRSQRACRDSLTFALYVAFFPQLVAGPIERAGRLLPQLETKTPLSRASLASGCWLILQGTFKKVALSDTIAPLVNEAFTDPSQQNAAVLWRGAYLFAFQIYLDFSGYSDVARGAARLLGVDLMENFRQPFFATSYTDLWRRWHVSLSTWFRDYVYVPLGGNRGGRLLTARNVLLTMTLSGLWHGARWNMVIWGLLNGLILVTERLVRGHQGVAPKRPSLASLPAMVLTFHLFVLVFVVFRAPDLSSAIHYWSGMAHIGGLFDHPGVFYALAFFGAFLLLFDLPAERAGHHLALLRWSWVPRGVLIGVLVVLLIVFSRGADVPFIYFQF